MRTIIFKVVLAICGYVLLLPIGNCTTKVTINVIGVPYMHALYDYLAGDCTIDTPFALEFKNGGTSEFAKAVSSGSAEFSISDVALSRKELETNGLIQFPAMVTAIVPVVNLPGIQSEKLILTGPVLASILSGEITVWNHESIRALNPDLTLPAIHIKPIARLDAPGATLAITSYLGKSSPKFNTTVGVGEVVKWPNAIQLLHSGEPLESAIRNTVGAISYVEMDVGNLKKMTFVKLKHKNGSVVSADLEFLRSGIVGAKTIENSGGADTLTAMDIGKNWPILLPIYITLPKRALDDRKISTALRFIFWTFNKADDTLEQSGLVPLPVELQIQAVKLFRTIQSTNGKSLKVVFDL